MRHRRPAAAAALVLLGILATVAPARADAQEIVQNVTSLVHQAATDAQDAVGRAVLFLTGGEAQATRSMGSYGAIGSGARTLPPRARTRARGTVP